MKSVQKSHIWVSRTSHSQAGGGATYHLVSYKDQNIKVSIHSR